MTGCPFRPMGDRAGFTLLEVLVALALLGIAITVILQLFSANLRALAASEDYVDAALRGSARMRELLDEADLDERAWSEVSPEGYRMSINVKEALTERTELLPVRLLEIDLSVQWTRGNRERSVSFQSLKLTERE